MRKPSKDILHDISQLAGGAVSLVSGLREELKRDMQERLDAMVSRLDLVPRKDFERLEAIVLKMRAEQEQAKTKAPAKTETTKAKAAAPKKAAPAKGTKGTKT
jgi:BMFP domain-containing protein YqiC